MDTVEHDFDKMLTSGDFAWMTFYSMLYVITKIQKHFQTFILNENKNSIVTVIG